MNLKIILCFALTFAAGFVASQLLIGHDPFSTATYTDGFELPAEVVSGVTGATVARASPSDHLDESGIKVYKDRVVLDVQDAIWAQFTPTNSMNPVLSEKANAIEVVPKSSDDVQEGDIVAYKSRYADGIIIHRVIKKGADQLGTYYIVKGDNNPKADPGLVRFEDIKSVVVGIIY
jgi:hypothetical protein